MVIFNSKLLNYQRVHIILPPWFPISTQPLLARSTGQSLLVKPRIRGKASGSQWISRTIVPSTEPGTGSTELQVENHGKSSPQNVYLDKFHQNSPEKWCFWGAVTPIQFPSFQWRRTTRGDRTTKAITESVRSATVSKMLSQKWSIRYRICITQIPMVLKRFWSFCRKNHYHMEPCLALNLDPASPS